MVTDRSREDWQARPHRPAADPVLHVRIAEELERLKQETTWQSGTHNVITLTKAPTLRMVLIVQKPGARLHEHQALRLQAAGREWDLKPGEVAVLESAIEHEVEAVEECAFLLTIVKPAFMTSSSQPGCYARGHDSPARRERKVT
jgi:quercetin dioxygenase-like cupin family protein